ncbi:hypothetical protein GIB67_018144 [Kingdonia uniflora]|uniref:Uncharacterized protein n=1 Tax=Kingdonia uniflora TaxID=39325 RepID=A0A7J7NMU4_9MAGN|nr:hypothetical protein GIB67_018144 [Kingdonia uniflora]
MSYEEVVEEGDDYYQMVRFHYLLTSEAKCQNRLRLLAEEAVTTKNEAADVRLRESHWNPATWNQNFEVVFNFSSSSLLTAERHVELLLDSLLDASVREMTVRQLAYDKLVEEDARATRGEIIPFGDVNHSGCFKCNYKARRSDRLLHKWIRGTLSEEVLASVVRLDTAFKVWNTLLDHLAQGSTEKEFFPLQEIDSIQKGTSNMRDYVRNFKQICDDLTAIGKSVDDRQKVSDLLKGLGSAYDLFVMTMHKPPVPSYSELIPLPLSHDAMKTLHGSQNDNHSMAFFGQRSQGNREGL